MPLATPPRLALSLLALLLPSTAAHADVLRVDGVHFADIQSAIDAAAEGDTVLVHDSEGFLPSLAWAHESFVIDGKSLAVVAEDESVLVSLGLVNESSPTVVVRNLAADQSVVVRGLELELGISVEDCAGPVWFDEVTVRGWPLAPMYCNEGGTHGASVVGSASVVFTHCRLQGENVSYSTYEYVPGDGLNVRASTVHAFDSVLAGGWGSSGSTAYFPPKPGAAGVRVEDGVVTLSGCTAEGGPGGIEYGPSGEEPCALAHAPGGPGAALDGAGAELRETGSAFVGGVADLGALCPGLFGPEGAEVEGPGSLVSFRGPARHLKANGPVLAGERARLVLAGVPGDLALLAVSDQPAPALSPLPGGALLGAPGGFPVEAGVVPAGGKLALTLPASELLAGASERLLYAQAVFTDASGARCLGGGAVLVLVDAP